MSKKARAKVTNAQYRARHRDRRAEKLRAEERSWAARSGPVTVYFREPPQGAVVQGEYAGDGAVGSARSTSRDT